MKLLLDTHIFLWFISGDSRLSVSFCDAIRNPDNDVHMQKSLNLSKGGCQGLAALVDLAHLIPCLGSSYPNRVCIKKKQI